MRKKFILLSTSSETIIRLKPDLQSVVNMAANTVGAPLETNVLLFKLLAQLDGQQSLFPNTYHASFGTYYLIG